MRLKKSWLWLLAASIGLSLALPLALGGLGQFKPLDRLSWWAALLFTLLMLMSWWFNSWRIRMLMWVGGRRMSWREGVLTTASAEFAGGHARAGGSRGGPLDPRAPLSPHLHRHWAPDGQDAPVGPVPLSPGPGH